MNLEYLDLARNQKIWMVMEVVVVPSLISLNRGSFDVIVGIDWLSKRKFVIVCHEKVVEIPLEGSRKLRVQGERNAKVDEPKVGDISVVRDFVDVFPEDLSGLPPQRQAKFRIDLVHGATLVAKSPYRLAPLEMQELSEQLQETSKGKVRASRKACGRPGQQMEKKRADDGYTFMDLKLYREYEYEIRYHPGMKCNGRLPVLWAEIGESSLIGPELVQEMTDKFEVGDRVMLKVSPWKGEIRFGKKGKLALSLHMPLDETKVDKTLRFVEEPVENSDCEVMRFGNQSIERDRLIGIGFVLDFVEFISFTFGDKEMIL
ncbi:hypothetical protein Tco_1006955 [Tanacetum coccineum]|uniref:Reverse transcriptase domain-containing protein n=1 Tax=Tanacetum coccineum TaxID=301880 RepID=A0ABQ5FJA9_9ASTR